MRRKLGKGMKRLLALALCAALSLGAPASSLVPAGAVTVSAAAKKGWVTKNGKTYYYVKGKKVTGVVKVDGVSYAFNAKGVLQGKTAVFVWKNKYYKVSAKGVAAQWKGTSALAAKLLAGKELSGKTAKAQLLKAFTYCANLPYQRVGTPSGSERQLADYYGKLGLSEGVGDCSVQAYSFYWLAKVLGYKVKVINGYTKSADYHEHSWVELTKGKKTYICDPNFSHEYGDQYTGIGKYPLGMMVPYGAKNTLKYFRADKTEIEAGGKA